MTEIYPPRFNDAAPSNFEPPPTCKAARVTSKIDAGRGSAFVMRLRKNLF